MHLQKKWPYNHNLLFNKLLLKNKKKPASTSPFHQVYRRCLSDEANKTDKTEKKEKKEENKDNELKKSFMKNVKINNLCRCFYFLSYIS